MDRNYKETEEAIFFFGYAHPFSNFYNYRFLYDNIYFENSESAFMYAKAKMFGDIDAMNALVLYDNQKNPKSAKAIGRGVKNFSVPVWERESFTVMINILVHKFSHNNNELGQTLIASGNKKIVEASPYDKKWGSGVSVQNSFSLNFEGKNLLGQSLEIVREVIQEEHFHAAYNPLTRYG